MEEMGRKWYRYRREEERIGRVMMGRERGLLQRFKVGRKEVYEVRSQLRG